MIGLYDTALNDRETLELAQRLVRIDSVNPSLVPGAEGEAALAHFVAGFLENRGLDVELRDALPGRPNVLARITGKGGGPSILLCCHLDTVSVEGMAEPFSGVVEDGRLLGRGAEDVKGGLAAMLAAAVVLSQSPPNGDVIVAGVADEEAYSAGTDALLNWGIRADMAIVFEPSELDVVIAHKGFAWIHLVTRGVAAHGSRPAEGVDAIAHMGRVLGAVEAHSAELSCRPPHPLLGAASVHASLIRGGRELSSYPNVCELDLERRTLPGETRHDILREMEQILKALGRDPQFEAELDLSLFRPAFEISEQDALPQSLKEAVERSQGPSSPVGPVAQVGLVGMTGWTDSALLAEAGIPAVVFGPGGSGLHSLEEWGDTEQICRCRDILVDFARNW
ncbi:MAG: ArgE/DapE family deacylase [Acidobacteriota bacterium]|nr:MAG: ArgE/DapE family deacylase [Acidobacteriota bacterium]